MTAAAENTATALQVPLADPSRAALALQQQLSDAFELFIASGQYIHGPEHATFEAEFADFLGVRHCVGVASGTDALELTLLAVGCKQGDAILTAANCGGYTATAAHKAGLRVRFADVDPTTLSLSCETVEAALTDGVRAVVVTHLYGLLGDVAEIAALCRKLGLALVEDCAQAAGARSNGRRAGSFGDAAAFSFYPTKNLAALGDGGAVTTNDADIAHRVRLLRQYGWAPKYCVSLTAARNSRLDELQAAVLRLRLPRLDEWNARRREIVERYADCLPGERGTFVTRPGQDYIGHLAVVLTKDRDALQTALGRAGVATGVHYPIADHQQPAWAADHAELQLPVTEHAVEHVLTLPCFPELRESEIEQVCEALRGL